MRLHLSTGIAMIMCCLFVSCGEKKDIPSTEAAINSDSLISGEKMVHILADVHMVEAALLLDRNKSNELKGNTESLYQGIFRKYHISRQRYDDNLRFYRQDPAALTKIYDKVIAELETRQQHFHPTK